MIAQNQRLAGYFTALCPEGGSTHLLPVYVQPDGVTVTGFAYPPETATEWCPACRNGWAVA